MFIHCCYQVTKKLKGNPATAHVISVKVLYLKEGSVIATVASLYPVDQQAPAPETMQNVFSSNNTLTDGSTTVNLTSNSVTVTGNIH